MKACKALYLLALAFIFFLSGCVARTYPLTRDRVDQDLSGGNRGYLSGQAPAGEIRERKATRTTQVFEVELGFPAGRGKRTEVKPAAPAAPADEAAESNRGYVSETNVPEEAVEPKTGAIEKYKVQKGDTLQKISQKFYGTTKKWNKIYEANKEVLKGPDKIYPGQIIDVPVEALKEPKENLK